MDEETVKRGNAKIAALLKTAIKVYKAERGGILIFDSNDGYRYMTTKSPHMRIIRFKRRTRTWKWVDVEDIMGDVKPSKEVSLDNVRRFCTNAARSFNKWIPVEVERDKSD